MTLPPVESVRAAAPQPRRGAVDAIPAYNRYRVYAIKNETGSTLCGVTYSTAECKAAASNPASNTKRCYPVIWSPRMPRPRATSRTRTGSTPTWWTRSWSPTTHRRRPVKRDDLHLPRRHRLGEGGRRVHREPSTGPRPVKGYRACPDTYRRPGRGQADADREPLLPWNRRGSGRRRRGCEGGRPRGVRRHDPGDSHVQRLGRCPALRHQLGSRGDRPPPPPARALRTGCRPCTRTRPAWRRRRPAQPSPGPRSGAPPPSAPSTPTVTSGRRARPGTRPRAVTSSAPPSPTPATRTRTSSPRSPRHGPWP